MGEPVTGREAKGLGVFAEALAYYGQAEQEAASRARRRSFSALMAATSRASFSFVEEEAQIAALRAEDEFKGIITRATLVVKNVGVAMPRSVTAYRTRSASTRPR